MRTQLILLLSLICSSFTLQAADAIPTPTEPVATPTAPAVTSPSTVTSPAVVAPTDATKSVEELSKDQWLDAITPKLPQLICEEFMKDAKLKQSLENAKMNTEQCAGVIPESVKKCRESLYPSIPDKITSTNASEWGNKLGECIGEDFAKKHLIAQ